MKGKSIGEVFEILLVEDNTSDVDLLKESLVSYSMAYNMNVVNDGIEAMLYLNKEGKYAQRIRPDLIILDLNLPKKNGFEVLKEIKTNPILVCIPVIILTSSQVSVDVKTCYTLHANAYIVKPNNLSGFRNVVRQLEAFWFETAELS